MKKRPTKKKSRGRSAQNAEATSRHQVFMSHATHDKWIAVEICRKIEERGVTTFRDDRDIQGGGSIPEAIADAIEDCDELAVLLTPESCGREWVTSEVAMAYVLKKRIVGIMYHVSPESAPALLRVNMPRMFHLNELEQYLGELAQRMGTE